MADRVDDHSCLIWVARPLQPEGLACPRCHRPERRLFRPQGAFPADHCRACDGHSPLRTHTVVEKTRQRPATLGLLRRGMAKGDPTARGAREWGLSGTQLHTLRQRVQAHLHATVPTGVMTGTALEADERYQHAGETKHAPSRSQRPAMSTRHDTHRPRHVCPCSAPPHPHDGTRHGCAALLGGRRRGQANVPYAHRRTHAGWPLVAVHRRMAERPGQSSRPCDGPPWYPRLGAG
jgi:hypothetical protein